MSNHVQLVTADRPHYLALKGSNVTTATSVSTKYATTTTPASGSGSAVTSGAMNYLKISPRFTNAGTSPSIRVIGWTKCVDSGLWIPHLITDVTATLDTTAANGQTINGTANMFGCSAFTKAQGDCKIFNSTSLSSCAFFVVDSGLWIPHLITDVTATLDTTAANGQTINGTASMFGCSAFTKAQGDCKIFNSTSLSSCAFFVVDTLGFDLIELAFRTTTTAATANAHLGDI